MVVLLLRDARIRHHAGEIVKVSPDEARFLITTGSAVEGACRDVVETPETDVKERETSVPVLQVPEEERETSVPVLQVSEEKTAAKETRTKKK